MSPTRERTRQQTQSFKLNKGSVSSYSKTLNQGNRELFAHNHHKINNHVAFQHSLTKTQPGITNRPNKRNAWHGMAKVYRKVKGSMLYKIKA